MMSDGNTDMLIALGFVLLAGLVGLIVAILLWRILFAPLYKK